MDKKVYEHKEFEIDFKEVLWSLLSQWKAVLLTALIMAVLVAGLKYYKSVAAYNAAVENARQAEEMAKAPSEQQIEEVLNKLSPDDRQVVEYIVQQKAWLDEEKDYFINSILLQTNPTSQRTLLLDYYIASEEPNSILASLVYGYSSYVYSDAVVNGLKEAIAPDSDNKYIAELIDSSGSKRNDKSHLVSYDDGDAVLEVRVVLPESADESAVEKVVTKAFEDYSVELGKSTGKHSIKLINASEAKLFNYDALSTRNSIIANINDIQNIYLKNAEAVMTDGQKSAVDKITSIKAATKSDEAKEPDTNANKAANEISKPGLSKGSALLGFVLGLIIYVGAYLVIVLMKGHINSATALENFTRVRLLGEVYYDNKAKGFEKLLHSKLVDKYRYKGKENCQNQIQKAIESLEALCNHLGTKTVTLYNLAEKNYAEDICDAAKEIKINAIDLTDEFSEKQLIGSDNAVFIAGRDTDNKVVSRLMELCSEYDINMMGSVYATTK